MLGNPTDIIYRKEEGIAWIIINRPERLNALRGRTLLEMMAALLDVWGDKSIGVAVITGAGDRAFCTGGDQMKRGMGGYVEEENVIPGIANLEVLSAHGMVMNLIKGITKPIIAAVNGYAIGAGHVLHLACDLSIAAEHARFGQVGPRVGSFDAGLGTVYPARVVGQKKAREIWYMCKQYSAQEALEMGLVNKVVKKEKLEDEVKTWCKELLSKSPTSLAFLKSSFNVDTDGISGLSAMSELAVGLFYSTEESLEGRNAFLEKRAPDFSRFRD